MKLLRAVVFIFLLIGLFYLEASRMFVVDTSIHFSILYPIGVLLCSLFIVKSGGVFLDRNNRGMLLLVVWLYIITLLHSVFTPLPAKYCYVTLILPSICLYLPQKLLNSNFNQKYFDRGNIVVFVLLLFYYFHNYQNNIFIDIDSQNNSAYTVLFFAPILLCINNKYIRYVVLFLTGIALFFSLKRSGIAAFSLGLVAFLYFTIKTSITQKNKFIYLIFICICLYSSLVLLQSILGERADLLSNRFTQLDDSGSGRDEIYKATWKLIGENSIMDFVIGHGYGGVLKNSPLACSAHNDYLEFLYDYGVIGLALLLSFMLKFGRLVIGLIRKKSNYAAPAAFTFVVVLINSCFSHVFYYEWYLLLIAIFWGYLNWNVKKESVVGQ